MALRSIRLRAFSPITQQPACLHFVPFQRRFYAAQPAPQVENELAAQAELAAKVKVLSPYHKVSFDDRKVRIPWQDGKTSSL